MNSLRPWWWLPSGLVAAVGVAALIGGLVSGGPDAIGGLVYGGVALLAAGVIHQRRRP